MSDFSKLSGLDISQLDLSYSANLCQTVAREIEENQKKALRAVEVARRERERVEQERDANLKRMADNSDETVNSLKEMNELLKNSNELLKRENENLIQKLSDMNLILINLFSVEVENGKEQNALMKQAVELATQIEMATLNNGKFDWKEMLANTTASTLFMALQVLLHSKGLL